MRQERTVQATLFEVFAQHEIGCELKAMSQWLDGQRALISLVADDLRRQGVRETGRLDCRRKACCAVRCSSSSASSVTKSWPFTSRIRRRFAPLPACRWHGRQRCRCCTTRSRRSALRPGRRSIKAVLASAKRNRLESGAMVRLDSTVTAALMHEPSDSALLWDAVRVMTRLLRPRRGAGSNAGDPLARPSAPGQETGATRSQYSRGPNKKRQLYRDLIIAAQATRAELQGTAKELDRQSPTTRRCPLACRGRPLSAADRPRVIDQTERRVFDGETVPAGEKLVSLFEPHADIIVKGGRRRSVRTQAQPDDRQERADPRCRHRSRKSRRRRALSADARPPHRSHRRAAAADRRRWWLRQPRQSRRRQGNAASPMSPFTKSAASRSPT